MIFEAGMRRWFEMEVLKEILVGEGYSSPDELIRDWALITALSKVEQYRAECEFFRRKYGMELEEFESLLRERKGQEDFEKEEDLEDWEFAASALKWWEKKLKELQDNMR